MPEDLVDRLDSGQQAIVNEVLARHWVTRSQIDSTVTALLTGSLDGPINRALLSQRLITSQQANQLEEYLHKQLIFGDFSVVRRIGAGAMGDVYLARDRETNEQVAIKAINSRYAGDEQFVKRFQREINILAEIQHPNVARAVGQGEHQGQPYLALEYVPGPSLAALLDRNGPLPESYVLRVAIQIAAGLEHIFDKTGLVHRDIKPENILTVHDDDDDHISLNEREDSVKLIDFGLARSYEADERLTMTGVTMGTPHYMSPEQIRGSQDVDQRSDIYSICATMYHLLTGNTPFGGGSPGEVMTAHLTQDIPEAKSLVPSLSDGTCQVLSTGLCKQPEERFLNYKAFCKACTKALDAISDGPTGPRLLRKPLVLSKPRSAKQSHGTGKHTGTGSKPKASPSNANFGQPISTSSHKAVAPPQDQQQAGTSTKHTSDQLARHPGSASATGKRRVDPSSDKPVTTSERQARSDSIRRKGVAQLAAENEANPGIGILPLVALAIAVVSLGAILVYRML